MDEYWLLRPIPHNFYTYKELLDGTLTLEDIAICNDFLDVQQTNENLLNQKGR